MTKARYGLLIFIGSLFVYALTASTFVTYEDSGEFILTAKYLGIAHPPGYPLYTLLGHLFSYLPIGTAAYREHFLNVFLGSLLNVVFFLTLLRFQFSQVLGFLATLIFAFSLNKWYQAIIAETYTLHTLFVLVLMNLAWDLKKEWENKQGTLFVFLYTLSLSNHWPLIAMITPIFLALLRQRIPQFLRLYKVAIPLIVLGLSPYAYLYFRSQADPFISFLGPLHGIGELWNYILRSYYARYSEDQKYSLVMPFKFLWNSIHRQPTEFSLPFAAFILVGAYSLIKNKKIGLALIFLYGYLSSSFLLYFLYKVEFAGYFLDNQNQLQLIPQLSLAFFVAFGLKWTSEEISKNRFKQMAFLGLVILGLSYETYANFQINDMRDDSFAHDYAKFLLELTPANSSLLLFGDADTYSVGYVAKEELADKNITLYKRNGIIYNHRIMDPKKPSQEQMELYYKFFHEKKNVFSVAPPVIDSRQNPDIKFINYGALIQVTTENPLPPELDFKSYLPEVEAILAKKLADTKHNYYWPYQQGVMFEAYCRFLQLYQGMDNPVFEKTFTCRTIKAYALSAQGRFAEADRILAGDYPDLPTRMSAMEASPVYDLWLTNLLGLIDSQTDKGPFEQSHMFNERLPMVYQALENDDRNCASHILYTVRNIAKNLKTDLDMVRVERMFAHCHPQANSLPN